MSRVRRRVACTVLRGARRSNAPRLPASARMTALIRSPTPGIVSSRARLGASRLISASMRSPSSMISASSRSMWLSAWRARNAWWSVNRPASAPRSMATLGRALPRARSASTAGSRCPAISASIISRPDIVRVRLSTVDTLIPASSRTVSSRLSARTRSRVRFARARVRSRSRRIGGGGTKEGVTRPCAANCASHCASLTSVLRPGTFLTSRALTSHTVNHSSSR